jgi:hypothetical protein
VCKQSVKSLTLIFVTARFWLEGTVNSGVLLATTTNMSQFNDFSLPNIIKLRE